MTWPYIRENAPAKSLEPTEDLKTRAIPRTDVQIAIAVLGRRSKPQVKLEWKSRFRLDLRNTDLSGIDFSNGNFSAATFYNARLEAVIFRNANLTGAHFHGALLNFTDFMSSELRGTIFDKATINRPMSPPGGMASSINRGEIYGISLVGADISAIDYLDEPTKTNLTFGSKDTKLHKGLELDRKKVSSRCISNAKIEKLRSSLIENDFIYWVPYGENDLAIGHERKQFFEELGLTKWPHQ